MLCPVIQKVIFSQEAFVERRLPPSAKGGADSGNFFVEEGSRVRPFDFVAEVPKDPARRRLTAGVGGEVVKLLPGKAVLIKTSAVVVRGVIGKGEDDEGEIRIAAEHNAPIEPSSVDAGCAGDVLVGGFVSSLEVFKKAEAVGVRGIVCGGADFAAFQKSNLPTLLVEGFGRPPLNRNVFEFLKKVEGRHIFLSPGREELLVARLGEEVEERPETGEVFVTLKEGMEVQIFSASYFLSEAKNARFSSEARGSYFGQMGKVAKVLADTVEVVLDSPEANGKIVVPGRNLGIIK